MDSSSKINVSYTLFLYRQELRRSQNLFVRLSRSKISLTDKLISKGVRNLKNCSMEDLRAINRQLVFKKKLENKIKNNKKSKKKKKDQKNEEADPNEEAPATDL
ncbi:uncharacterized protein LOC135955374 [Calliphora vicina]|uniref:uncharacterized protein LOC135955374 n=1 Tax=Calliphora vicina TaxID=7373 RepID=UPI00325C244D